MFNSAYTLGGLVHFAAVVWVLYEVWGVNKSMRDGRKILWSIGALFFSIITAILYYFVEKKKAI